MKIQSLKFGDTDTYIVDGKLVRGIIWNRQSYRKQAAEWLFASSLAALLIVSFVSFGEPYAKRAVFLLNGYAANIFGANKPIPVPQEAEILPAVLPSVPAVILPDKLVIEKIGVKAPVSEMGSAGEHLVKALDEGLALWSDGQRKGKAGVLVVTGHSSAPLGYKGSFGSVFTLLDKLEKGDEIVLSYKGESMKYKVYDNVKIDPRASRTDPEKLRIEGQEQTLILSTCWPIGTNWQRIAVRAINI
jgi:LPXTG-site transpeptidase (sortase) family protein